jgi:hypothetical protein
MPTFQSVSLDPTVRELFTGRSRALTTTSSNKSSKDTADDDNNSSTNDTSYTSGQQQDLQLQENHRYHQQKLTSGGRIAGISTPRSMLTRAPHDLVEVFLRSQKDLSSRNNKIAGEEDYDNSSKTNNSTPSRKRDRTDEGNTSGESNDTTHQRLESVLLDHMEGIRNQVAHKMIQRTRTGTLFHLHSTLDTDFDVLIPGATYCPLDVWKNYSCQSADNMTHMDRVICTGCEALDRLLSFPIEAADVSSSATQKFGRRLGLPLGYVLQISGTSSGKRVTKGKTQLALQFAARTIKNSMRKETFPDDQQRQHEQQAGVPAVSNKNHIPFFKVRYCFSAGGHAGHNLAKRFLELVSDNEFQGRSSHHHHGRKKSSHAIPAGGDQIEFQSISQLSQLTATLAVLEEDWVETLKCMHSNKEAEEGNAHHRSHLSRMDRPSLLIVDGLQSIPPEQDETQYFAIERRLKRIARQYSIGVIVVGGGIGRDSMDVADCHLNLSEESLTKTKVQLLRHPVKLVTEKDCISLLHNSKYGMSTGNLE